MSSSSTKETAAERLAHLRAKQIEEERQVQREIEELEKEAALEAKREEEKRKAAERAAARRAAETERQQRETAARAQREKGKKRARTLSTDLQGSEEAPVCGPCQKAEVECEWPEEGSRQKNCNRCYEKKLKCEGGEKKEKAKVGVEKRRKATMEVVVPRASGSRAPAPLSRFQERMLELEEARVEAIRKMGQGINTRLDALWEVMDGYVRREKRVEMGAGKGKEKETEEDKVKEKEKDVEVEMEMETETEKETEVEEGEVRPGGPAST